MKTTDKQIAGSLLRLKEATQQIQDATQKIYLLLNELEVDLKSINRVLHQENIDLGGC